MTLEYRVHKNILVQILIDVYSDTTISPYLGFKGGTAAYLFYGLERFSVDIDLDLLDESKKELVLGKIEGILKNYGDLKEGKHNNHGALFLLAYNSKKKNHQNVKIDINYRDFESEYEIKTFNGISMLVMKTKDMFAHKLVAMYERMEETKRDVFDVWFFSKNNWEVNREIIRKRTGKEYKEFLADCIQRLEKLDNKNILFGLGELIDDSQKDWVKAKLKTETIVQLKLRFDAE